MITKDEAERIAAGLPDAELYESAGWQEITEYWVIFREPKSPGGWFDLATPFIHKETGEVILALRHIDRELFAQLPS